MRYLIIDDDPINNFICQIIINRALNDVYIRTFTSPQEGLSFLEREYKNSFNPTVLLLDINMPGMSGWEFMEHFEKMDENLKNQFTIYILSSSVDERDKERASMNKNIKDYLEKPLNQEMIRMLNEDHSLGNQK